MGGAAGSARPVVGAARAKHGRCRAVTSTTTRAADGLHESPTHSPCRRMRQTCGAMRDGQNVPAPPRKALHPARAGGRKPAAGRDVKRKNGDVKRNLAQKRAKVFTNPPSKTGSSGNAGRDVKPILPRAVAVSALGIRPGADRHGPPRMPVGSRRHIGQRAAAQCRSVARACRATPRFAIPRLEWRSARARRTHTPRARMSAAPPPRRGTAVRPCRAAFPAPADGRAAQVRRLIRGCMVGRRADLAPRSRRTVAYRPAGPLDSKP